MSTQLDESFGAVLVGTYFGTMLYGFTLHQAYRYTRLSPNDTLFIKLVVSAVLLFETVHTIQCMHIGYYYLVTNYFNPEALGNGVWSIDLIPMSAGLVIITSQIFFVWRVYKFGKKYQLLVIAVVCLLVVELVFLTAATAETFIQHTFVKFERITWLIGAGFGVASLADTILTTALIITLRQSRTGFKRTDSVIEILILYAVTTGLLTTVFNILTFIFSIAFDNNVYIAFDIAASKLYATSLLAALNARHSIGNKSSGVSTVFGTTRVGQSESNHSTNISDRLRVGQLPPVNTFHMDTDLQEFAPTKSDHAARAVGYGDEGSERTSV